MQLNTGIDVALVVLYGFLFVGGEGSPELEEAVASRPVAGVVLCAPRVDELPAIALPLMVERSSGSRVRPRRRTVER